MHREKQYEYENSIQDRFISLYKDKIADARTVLVVTADGCNSAVLSYFTDKSYAPSGIDAASSYFADKVYVPNGLRSDDPSCITEKRYSQESSADSDTGLHAQPAGRRWHLISRMPAYIGKTGLSANKKEGDMLTPIGYFDIPYAFGNLPDPGSRLPYIKVTPADYYVDDPLSPSYNTWVNTDRSERNFGSAEHLSDIRPEYDYAALIDYNHECVPGNGSAVFLHCTGKNPYTAGCVAIDHADMSALLTEMIPPVKIIILENQIL